MALKGNQSKLDVNKNGKLDRQDFVQLRNQKTPTTRLGAGESKAKGKKQAMPRKKGM